MRCRCDSTVLMLRACAVLASAHAAADQVQNLQFARGESLDGIDGSAAATRGELLNHINADGFRDGHLATASAP